MCLRAIYAYSYAYAVGLGRYCGHYLIAVDKVLACNGQVLALITKTSATILDLAGS